MKSGKKQRAPAEVYTMTDLEQVRVLSDPLRVRLLEAFCDEPRTTKQVAALLGEKPTRLYHHVETLERVGLVRLADTRQVRGTVEKYYVAVAQTFRADPAMFHGAAAKDCGESLSAMATTVMDNTADELRRLVRGGADLASGKEGIVGYLEVRASAAEIDDLRRRLLALLEQVEQSPPRKGARRPSRRYRLTLAFYPLDPAGAKDGA